MRCIRRWLLPVALAIPGVVVAQETAAPDCSLPRPLATGPAAFDMPAAASEPRTPRLMEISRRHTPAFTYSSVWAPPAFAQPARPRGNALPRFLARNPLLAKPLIRKLANQLAGRDLFDTPSAGHRRISISPHVDPSAGQFGVRVKLSLARPD